MLLYTGTRDGTGAMGLRRCDVAWHEDKGQRHSRLFVNGKTDGYFIIDKYLTVPDLQRLLRSADRYKFCYIQEITTK